MRTAAILLAAGESRRMGTAKQLLPWGETTLACHAASVAAAAGLSPVVAVVGARAAAVAAAFSADVEVVVNEDWRPGPGGSVAAGVRHVLASHPDVSAVLLTPADLPRVTADDLRELVKAAETSPCGVAASRFRETVGAPACFASRHFAALTKLNAAKGAGPLIRRLTEEDAGVAVVPLEAAAEDVDEPGDYARMRQEEPDPGR